MNNRIKWFYNNKAFKRLSYDYGDSPATTYIWLREKNQPASFAHFVMRLQWEKFGRSCNIGVSNYRKMRV
jgi:hypothetical protein